ncbi:hypothetical protein GCM10023346_17310 [Arthrobacter gyeryongensis]|uniref:Uncharacterized protein n=2 Tax=Arthrobacter gyeryongensis TaxID=1650592 RepID=A0ABP9SAL5_9MICC
MKIARSSQVFSGRPHREAWQALRALKNIKKIALILAVSAGLVFAGLAPASAAEPPVTSPSISESPAGAARPELREPAGKYYSFCISMGVSHNWTNNRPSTCPGYLHVYIGGKQVAHLNIGASTASFTWTCAAGVGLNMVLVFAPGGAVVGWALAGTLSSIGLTLAGCAGW